MPHSSALKSATPKSKVGHEQTATEGGGKTKHKITETFILMEIALAGALVGSSLSLQGLE